MFLACLLLFLAPWPPGPQTLAAPAAETRIRMLRSTSGTRGTQRGGHYVIEDPRSVFSAAQDRQVIVSFEWEGSPGTCRFEGRPWPPRCIAWTCSSARLRSGAGT